MAVGGEPHDINENGAVVGTGMTGDGTYKGFLFSSGMYTELLPPGWKNANAMSINDNGSVVGAGEDQNGIFKGYVYTAGAYSEIMPESWRIAQAQDINNNGVVAGVGVDQSVLGIPDSSSYKGFMYSGGTYTILLFPGWLSSYVMGLNDYGVVVGWGDASGTEMGFSYRGGIYTELLPAGWVWCRADNISRNGIVAGHGADASGTKGFIAIPPANTEPIANAGASQTVHAGRQVSLDGSESTDPDGNLPLSYAWSFLAKPAGSPAVLANATSMTATFIPDLPGNYVVQLIVTDSLGAASLPASATITATNSAPRATAGPDQTVSRAHTIVQMDGTRSYDPDGDAITYQWSFLSVPAKSNSTLYRATTAHPRFVADVHGTYVLQLVVSDPWTQSVADTVTVSFKHHEPGSRYEQE